MNVQVALLLSLLLEFSSYLDRIPLAFQDDDDDNCATELETSAVSHDEQMLRMCPLAGGIMVNEH